MIQDVEIPAFMVRWLQEKYSKDCRRLSKNAKLALLYRLRKGRKPDGRYKIWVVWKPEVVAERVI